MFARSGRHLRTLDSRTNTVLFEFAYAANGLLTSVTDADGDVTSIQRDAVGKPTALLGPFGQSTQLLIDNSGDLRRYTMPSGRELRMDYSEFGLLTAMSDPAGGVTEFTYDPEGRLVRDDDRGDGFKTLSRVDRPKSQLPPATRSQFDVTLATAMGVTSNYEVKEVKGARGLERHKTRTRPDGTSTTTVARGDGLNSASSSEGASAQAQSKPDPRFGSRAPYTASVTARTPEGLQVTASRSRSVQMGSSGNLLDLTSQTDMTTVNGKTTTDQWSKITAFSIPQAPGLGGVTQPPPAERTASFSAGGRIATAENDAVGRPLRVSPATGIEPLAFAYDAHGRVTGVAQGARSAAIEYNFAGHVAQTVDPLGRATSYEYDADGNVTAAVLPGARRAEFAYDDNGNLTSVTPPSRPAHLFAYNPLDLATSYDAPPVGTEPRQTTFDYDDDQRLTGLTRPDGQQITVDYDTIGRPTRVAEPHGDTEFTYSPSTGRIATATSPDAVTRTYAWDGPLPTAQTTSGPAPGTVGYDFDQDLRPTVATVGSDTIPLTYDDDSLLTSAGPLQLGRSLQTGLPTSTTLSQIATTSTFDSYAELQHVTATSGAQSLFDMQLTRDALGRVQSKTETTLSGTTAWSYLYDTAGRLQAVEKNGQPHRAYTYDQNNNITQVVEPQGPVRHATYDDQDRLTAFAGESFAYNPAGEMTSRTDGQDTTAYSYNATGNLKTAQLPDGTQIEYLLDAEGNRVAKERDGQVTERYLYGPEAITPVAKVDGQGDTLARYVYASSSSTPDYIVQGGNTYRVITDQLGSARLVVDAANGQVAQELSYDEYGAVTADSNPGFQPFGFAGGLYDRDTGLVHFGEREYDPRLGRFTSVDPIGFGGGSLNLHSYVLGDPVNWVDPSGLLGMLPEVPNLGYEWAKDTITPFMEDAQRGAAETTNDPNASNWDKFRAWAVGIVASAFTCENFDKSVTVITVGTGGFGAVRASGYTNLFGRGGQGILNNNDRFRVGRGWKGPRDGGREVFRIGVGKPGTRGHRHWDIYEK